MPHFTLTEDDFNRILLVKETLDTFICLSNSSDDTVHIPRNSLDGAFELMRSTLETVENNAIWQANSQPKKFTHTESAMIIKGRIGKNWTENDYNFIQSQYPSGLGIDDIEEVITQITESY